MKTSLASGQKPLKSLLNGEPAAVVDLSNRGLNYGDGLFETLKVINGRPAFWDQHLQRLERGCAALKIVYPDVGQLHADACQLLAAHQASALHTQVLKITLTRQAGGRGYRYSPDAAADRLLVLSEAPVYPSEFYEKGISLYECQTRLGWNPQLAGIKHLNRLEQVLARSEWQDEHAEGVVLDLKERVIEGTMSNLFVLQGETLMTPALDHCGVEGIVRTVVMDIAAALGLQVQVTELRMADLRRADSLFMTNALIGIWPVRSLAGQVFQPQPLLKALMQRLAEAEQQSLQSF